MIVVSNPSYRFALRQAGATDVADTDEPQSK